MKKALCNILGNILASAVVLMGMLSVDSRAEPAGSMLAVDTALVVAVDVSNSVDDERYKLQMEGIATALEDKSVIDAITNGPNGGILFSMVTWADRPNFSLPWMRIGSKEEAFAVAKKLRNLPQQLGEFV